MGIKIGYAEELNIITYYPAPFGAYDRLLLPPRDELDVDPCKIGMLYSNEDDDDELYICQDYDNDSENDGEWLPVSPWKQREDAGG